MWASLWFKGDIKAREAGGISGEEAFKALRQSEISMEIHVDGEGRGPKIELMDSYHWGGGSAAESERNCQ